MVVEARSDTQLYKESAIKHVSNHHDQVASILNVLLNREYQMAKKQ